jgi:hypothetical protein
MQKVVCVCVCVCVCVFCLCGVYVSALKLSKNMQKVAEAAAGSNSTAEQPSCCRRNDDGEARGPPQRLEDRLEGS